MHLWSRVKRKDSINAVSSWSAFCLCHSKECHTLKIVRPSAIISSLYSNIEMLLTGGRVDTQRSFVGEYFYCVSSERKVQKASKKVFSEDDT